MKRILALALALLVVTSGCIGTLPGENSTPTTPNPAPTPDSESSYEQRVEAAMHEEVNRYRAQAGARPLTHAEDLRKVAKDHSTDMATRGYFSHTNPEGESPFTRMRNAGINCWSAGENILYNYEGRYSPEDAAKASINQWMNSPGHRANILNGNYAEEGIGVHVREDGRLYATQVFCTR